MNQIVPVNNSIYIPEFDENNDCYIDKSPYKPYERNCIRYECRCKAGSSFVNNMMFKQHIKSKTHKDFIRNYSKYYKEIDDSKEIIKNLKAEIELLKRKNNNLVLEIKELKEDNLFYDCQ